MEWLRQVLNGSPDAATIEHVRRGFDLWLKSSTKGRRDHSGKRIRPRPVALSRCLGLPDNPELVRLRQRDNYLREAGQLLQDELEPTQSVATALHKAVEVFEGHRWLCWVDMTAPPPNASALDRLLFLARRANGGELPTTARQYATILKS